VADTCTQTSVITAGFAVWSFFTAACGLVDSYLPLLVMWMGVGEASLSPAAYSLITDSLPPDRRGRAQGVYYMGIYLGAGAALVIGGV
jgi:MFS family permease